jgi:hypothetical protein
MVSLQSTVVYAHYLDCLVANTEDSTSPEKQPSIVHTVVRPLGKLPAGFEAKIRAEKSAVKPMANEKMLLNNLLGTFMAPTMK